MSANRIVPFYGLADEWAEIKEETTARISSVFDHGRFVEGPEIEELEAQIAKELGAKHVYTCSSGTTALLIAMLALGITKGDEVIIPSFTFAAPVECALLLGAIPVLVDVDYPTGLINVDSVKSSITPKSKAVVAVSLFGQVPNFEALLDVAERHNLQLIEDAAQSYGARWKGTASGTFGRVSCLSFFPTKVLGGAGDGGAVVTDDADLANRIQMVRDHGQDSRYKHICLGLNGRLSSIAAAALLVRHKYLDSALSKRRSLGRLYDTLFEEAQFADTILFNSPGNDLLPARSQYAVAVSERDKVRAALMQEGVNTAVYYPSPLHHQPAFRTLPRAPTLNLSEKMAKEVLCLPIHPSLDTADVKYVASTLKKHVQTPTI